MPNDNIDRIIKRAAGDGDDTKYENITYEGYGPNGIAVIVETLTDNRNRTAGDLRHYFDKFGGNLGTNGCVSFLFNRKGVLVIEREGLDEDKVMEDALEVGASDFQADDDVFEIYTEPDDFSGVLSDLGKQGLRVRYGRRRNGPDYLHQAGGRRRNFKNAASARCAGR